jgi:hypothetical protein
MAMQARNREAQSKCKQRDDYDTQLPSTSAEWQATLPRRRANKVSSSTTPRSRENSRERKQSSKGQSPPYSPPPQGGAAARNLKPPPPLKAGERGEARNQTRVATNAHIHKALNQAHVETRTWTRRREGLSKPSVPQRATKRIRSSCSPPRTDLNLTQ